jgi:hypothetical protein
MPLDCISSFVSCLIFYGVDAGGGGDDVDDGVYRADLMEVNFFDGDVVDLGFACAEEFEGVDGGLSDGGEEGCGGYQIADDGEGAAVGVFMGVLVFVRMVVGVAGFVLVLGFGVVLVGVGLLVVQEIPLRSTFSILRLALRLRAKVAWWRIAGSRPESMRAPRNMSPLMPAKQSR